MVKDFGITKEGESTQLYTLINNQGMEIDVTNYGASLVNVRVPKEDKIYDVVLGYDNVADYEKAGTYFGATIGRNANRIGNALFKLNGKEYQLEKNENNNNLHSGYDYYNKRIWKTNEVDEHNISFYIVSEDGDQGFPGEVLIEVMYELTDNNELIIHYYCKAKDDTIVNLTNHSYFNLNGHNTGTILNHKMWIDSDSYTPTDKYLIPIGEIISVENTPMDFRKEKIVGKDINKDYEALKIATGYDHNYVLKGEGYRKVATLVGDVSDILMEIYTDTPGMQVYSGNFIDNEPGKDSSVYQRQSGICFETQYFPNAINQEGFKSPIVKKDEIMTSVTAYKFV